MSHRLGKLVVVAGLATAVGGCPAPPDPLACGSGERVVELETEDGLTLRADFSPGPSPDAPAVLLLHMRPPANDRTGYPPRVRESLADLGMTVLNLDRRGAGDSEGEPDDAFVGEGGLFDVEAAMRFLTDDELPCPVAADRIAMVSASNGTTSSLDYFAGHDPALPAPRAMVWLSPGEYTENQTALVDVEQALRALPMLWLYPTTEPWAEAWAADAPPTWTLIQRGEAHGTHMFDDGDLEAATLDDIEALLQEQLLP